MPARAGHRTVCMLLAAVLATACGSTVQGTSAATGALTTDGSGPDGSGLGAPASDGSGTAPGIGSPGAQLSPGSGTAPAGGGTPVVTSGQRRITAGDAWHADGVDCGCLHYDGPRRDLAW